MVWRVRFTGDTQRPVMGCKPVATQFNCEQRKVAGHRRDNSTTRTHPRAHSWVTQVLAQVLRLILPKDAEIRVRLPVRFVLLPALGFMHVVLGLSVSHKRKPQSHGALAFESVEGWNLCGHGSNGQETTTRRPEERNGDRAVSSCLSVQETPDDDEKNYKFVHPSG